MFVGHFPNLRSLTTIDTSLQADDLPCDRLAELEPEYNELRFFGEYKHGLVAAVERSLEPFTLTLLLLTSS